MVAGLLSLPSEVRLLSLADLGTLSADRLYVSCLPVNRVWQLIWDIHQLALTPALPLASVQIFRQLASPPPALAARFLLAYHRSAPASDLLSRILRHGICSLATFQAVERLWHERRARSGDAAGGPLEVRELPKRLFRHVLEPGSEPARVRDSLLPFLDYLFDNYRPCPSSHKGYPLCGSITEHPASLPLTRYLLDKGADPSLKDGYAVLLAIDKRDLDLVRMLVEGGWEKGGRAGGKRKRAADDAGEFANDSPKRRKKADRVAITSKMRA
jgi:hypothetical protein